MDHQKNVMNKQKENRNRSNAAARGVTGPNGRQMPGPLSCGSPTPSSPSGAISPMSNGLRGMGTDQTSDRKTIESYHEGDENEEEFFFS